MNQSKLEGEIQKVVYEAEHKYCRDKCPDRNKIAASCVCGERCSYIDNKFRVHTITQHILSMLPTQKLMESIITDNCTWMECNGIKVMTGFSIDKIAKAILAQIKKGWGVK